MPASSCGPLQYEGSGSPDYLIATDLPMQGGSRTQTLQMVGAIKYQLGLQKWGDLDAYRGTLVGAIHAGEEFLPGGEMGTAPFDRFTDLGPAEADAADPDEN